jgi:hypothetical protein
MTTSKTRITNKDLQVAYLVNGVAGVQAMTADNVPAKLTFQAAIDSLESLGQEVAPLVAFMETHYSSDPGAPRTAPQNGETRTYKVGQPRDGAPKVNIPLNTLNAAKGDNVNVSFENGKIVITLQ